MVNLYGGMTFRVSDFRESIFDKLKAIGGTCLAVQMFGQAYEDNAVVWKLPVPMTQVLYGDQMRLGNTWLKAKGLKLCIYATGGIGLAQTPGDYARIITESALADQWIAQWSRIINALQPDSFELMDECPDAALSGNSALTFDAYWNWAIKCIDAYRAVKPDLNIMLTNCPFWDMHSIAAKPIPRSNVTYAFHLHYFGTEPSPSWTPYAIAYDEGRLADAKALLETYLLDTCGVRAALDAGLDLSFVFGSDYRTKPNWAAFLNDMYDFCRRHKIDSYFHYCWTTETYDEGTYPLGVWNRDYTALNVMGQLMATNIAKVPVTHTLTVNTSPTGVPFKLNGVDQTTLYSSALNEGTYIITMPSNVQVDSNIYNFKQWADGSTNPVKTINLLSDMTVTAIYKLYTQPPTPKGYLQIHAFYQGNEVSASGSVNGIAVASTPVTLELDPKAYTITLTYAGKTKTKFTTVIEGQTIREDVEIVPPPTPIPSLARFLGVVGLILAIIFLSKR